MYTVKTDLIYFKHQLPELAQVKQTTNMHRVGGQWPFGSVVTVS